MTDGRRAADAATARTSLQLTIPGGWRLRLPSADTLAYAAGLTLLGALEVLDWPVVAAIGVGHLISRSRDSAVIREFGEALEEG